MITGGRRTTPTAGMSALIGLPPLHLFIQGQALETNYKFSLSELKEVRSITDVNLNKIQEKYDEHGYCVSDYMLSKYNFRSLFTVSISKREEWPFQYQYLREKNGTFNINI